MNGAFDWHTDVKLLGMKKKRLEAMKRLQEDAVRRRQSVAAQENPRMAIREDLNINRLTAEINKLGDEIFSIGRKLGIDTETGEILENGAADTALRHAAPG